jgi:hypothetical protein
MHVRILFLHLVVEELFTTSVVRPLTSEKQIATRDRHRLASECPMPTQRKAPPVPTHSNMMLKRVRFHRVVKSLVRVARVPLA